MLTRRIYYEDSFVSEFCACVLSCNKEADGRYAVILDKTAFFPEGGGQSSDIGTLDSVNVTYVHEKNGEIIHYTDGPLTEGASVCGKLDFDRRFRFMQNHGGEHIVSGVVNKLFGLDNVGFHLGSEDVTVDYNGFLDRETLFRIEREANSVVFRNVPIKTEFFTFDELADIKYRSKKKLNGEIRIVTIEGCDTCACCAPHVNFTGQIGMIKLLDAIKYKGGIRIHMLCGFDALDDYNRKYESVRHIANAMSAKQDSVASSFDKFASDFADSRAESAVLRNRILDMKLERIEHTEGNLCLFEEGLNGDALRRFADAAAEKCDGICAVFSGSDGAYNYIIVSRRVDLKPIQKEINEALRGKGGGSSLMLQGRGTCTEAEARAYFKV